MESTLALKRSDLRAKIGLYLGWGQGAVDGYNDPAWTPRQFGLLKGFIDSGTRRFYWPPPVPPSPVPHSWSFLKPVALFDFAAATQSQLLPFDFGGFEGGVSVQTPATPASWWRVPVVSIGRVHQMYAELPQASGPPQMVAISPRKGTGSNQGSRMDLWVWPQTDTDYTFQFQYYLQPNALTDQNPYYYGGAMHSDTVLESCLVSGENLLDDTPLQECNHWGTFMERLGASVFIDNRNKPQTLGLNEDKSDMMGRRTGRVSNFAPITFNGVVYG